VNWSSVFVAFVVMLSMFSTPGQQKNVYDILKSTPPINGQSTTTSDFMQLGNPDNMQIATENNQADLNAYQVIISYMMDNYKNVYLADVLTIAENIVQNCAEQKIDPLLFAGLLAVESEFNRQAVSASGAKGLGQLMPVNIQIYGVSDPFDIAQNIRASSKMMRELINAWDGDMNYALASYFEGINAIKRNKGNPFKPGTANYVYRVYSKYNAMKQYL